MLKQDYSLARFSWFKVGGKADFFSQPEDIEQLRYILSHGIRPVSVIGAGSNLLIRDGGLRGLVIKLGQGFDYILLGSRGIRVGGATLCSRLAKFALNHDVAGFAFFSGIPGTIGGATFMNAGCFGADTSTVLQEVTVMDLSGAMHVIDKEDCGYSYRSSNLGNGLIIVEALFEVHPGCREDIANEIANITYKRESSQPIHSRTCGSVFKNPEGQKAWELIQRSGCAEMSYEGCEVSRMHSNFVINVSSKKASHIEHLCEQIRAKVLEVTGFELVWEVVRIGEYSERHSLWSPEKSLDT